MLQIRALWLGMPDMGGGGQRQLDCLETALVNTMEAPPMLSEVSWHEGELRCLGIQIPT